MNAFPWAIFFILLAAGILGAAAVLPYALTMNPNVAQKLKEATDNTSPSAAKPKLKLPMPVLFLISLIQSGILIALTSFLGLLATQKIGLGLPILQAALQGQPVMGKILEMLPASVLLGAGGAILILVLEALYFMPRIPRVVAGLDHRSPLWMRALACFYGGIDEEIICRLFLMGGLAWLAGLIWKDSTGLPTVGALWLANLLASVLFGLGHLPGTASMAKLTPIIVIRAVMLNGILGVAFGYLYMRYGLEAAMLSHFSADIVLHLLSVPIMRRRAESLPQEMVSQVA